MYFALPFFILLSSVFCIPLPETRSFSGVFAVTELEDSLPRVLINTTVGADVLPSSGPSALNVDGRFRNRVE